MSSKRARKSARRIRGRCKPFATNTREAAERALERIAKETPLKALGMRAYRCPTCDKFHLGRAPSR